MNAKFIAAICESVYYNGRVKSGSEKLEFEDFEQLVKAAHGSIMRKLYYELRQLGNELLYFSDALDVKEYKVSVSGNRKYIELGDDVVSMPHGLGILGVSGISSDNNVTHYVKGKIGDDWLYSGDDFSTVKFYLKKGRRVFLYNDECLKDGSVIEVEGLYNDDDVQIPKDIAFDIINSVLGLTLKVAVS